MYVPWDHAHQSCMPGIEQPLPAVFEPNDTKTFRYPWEMARHPSTGARLTSVVLHDTLGNEHEISGLYRNPHAWNERRSWQARYARRQRLKAIRPLKRELDAELEAELEANFQALRAAHPEKFHAPAE